MNQILIFLAEYLIYLMGAGALLVGWISLPDRRKFLFYLLKLAVALGVTLFATYILEKIFPAPRPFVVDNLTPLVAHAPDNSFPSSHAAVAASLASFTWMLRRDAGVAAFVAALLVGFGRIATLLHYPVDVVGGLTVGLLASYLVWRFWPRMWA